LRIGRNRHGFVAGKNKEDENKEEKETNGTHLGHGVPPVGNGSAIVVVLIVIGGGWPCG
jgi:hypothetical protein